ncbi:MAG: BREX system serine/threonine kinase PglW, partial [Actinomycetes bacterium]
TPPDGLAPLADTRLVALAAAASRDALVSPRFELYPRGLDLFTALRVSQAAAGVRATGMSMDDLLTRVRSRFPEVRVPDGLTHVQMTEMLGEAGFPLEFDLESHLFRPIDQPRPRRSTTASSTTLGRPFVSGQDPHEVTRTRLAGAVDRGGFTALTVRGRNLPGAASAIARNFAVRPVDVGAVFLAEFRALVAERGQDWGKVLRQDARFDGSGPLARGLASYVKAGWQRVQAHLAEQAAGGEVLLLHDAGLMGRYADAGGRDLLVALQAAARNPERMPHGLWLLCPGESAAGSPHLDRLLVEVVELSEQVRLDGDFLDGLRGQATDAA